jgi:Na+/proline symporter
LFAIHRSLVLNAPNPFYNQGFAIINAFVLAKVMFVAEAFNVADNLKRKPWVYPIAFKSAVFTLILISFHILEEFLTRLWHDRSIAASIDALRTEGLQLTVFGLIMFVVLMPFFAFRELARDIGNDRLFEQFFLRRNRYVPLQS